MAEYIMLIDSILKPFREYALSHNFYFKADRKIRHICKSDVNVPSELCEDPGFNTQLKSQADSVLPYRGLCNWVIRISPTHHLFDEDIYTAPYVTYEIVFN